MEMDTAIRVRILGKAICILHILRNINRTILASAMTKKLGSVDSLILEWQPDYEKEKSEIKHAKLRLKNWLCLPSRSWSGISKYLLLPHSFSVVL